MTAAGHGARGGITGAALAAPALAWLAGTAWQLQERSLSPFVAYVGCALAGAVLLGARVWAGRFAEARSNAMTSGQASAGVPAHRSSGVLARALAGFPMALLTTVVGTGLLGFAAAGMQASTRLAEALPAVLEGRTVEATGVVASLPQRGPDGLRFRFDVESARVDGRPVALPSHLALGWYRGQREDAAIVSPRADLRAGQRWRFELRLKRPHGNLNPDGFDYELNLFEQGVRATGYVRDARPLLIDRAAAHPVERLRQHVRDAIDAAVADRHAAGVLAALSVGDQSAIDHDDWDLFRATGIAHLVSISGV